MVPKHYGEFKKKVLSGIIPVCQTISMEMNRIDSLIDNPSIYYSPDTVEGFIKFCENELTLTDGSDFQMTDAFKLWAEQLYGWYYFEETSVFVPNLNSPGGKYVRKQTKRRLTHKQFILVGRGAAKTMYDEFVGAYETVCNRKTTYTVVTAPTMRQAEETIGPLKTAITRSKGPLFSFLTEGSINSTTGSRQNRVKLTPTKKGIENFITNSLIEIRPMTIDKLQGLRQDVAIVDEWLSGDIREDVFGALEQSGSKHPDYIILGSSSEGTVRNGPGDDIKMELLSILKGEYIRPDVSIFWYQLDDIKEVAHPDLWVKANPNLGVTVSYKAYQNDVEKAEKIPSARNDILAKRFNIALEGFTYYFTYDEIKVHKKQQYWNMPCSLGADLSRGDDFCAFVFLFPLPDGRFGIKTRCYITSLTFNKLPSTLRKKYEDFINEDSLQIFDGTILNMMDVYDDLDNHIISKQYTVCTFGYDPYNATDFIKRWINENGEYGVRKVIQGKKTESVPLGELKKLAEERMLLFDEEIMSFAMGNAITMTDVNGNRMLLKKRNEQKIDPVAAMMDAFIAYKDAPDNFE